MPCDLSSAYTFKCALFEALTISERNRFWYEVARPMFPKIAAPPSRATKIEAIKLIAWETIWKKKFCENFLAIIGLLIKDAFQ